MEYKTSPGLPGMLQKIILSCWVLPLTATVACYADLPPRPTTVTLPALSDNATIATSSTSVFENEEVAKEATHCPQGTLAGNGCSVTRYTETQSVKHLKTSATYGGAPITYAQFKVLTDPDYSKKLVTLEHARAGCKGGSLPRWAGIGLGVASVYLMAYSNQLVGAAVLGAGTASYTYGYVRYAKPCNQAHALYRQVDFSQDIDNRLVDGEDRAREMQTLAEQFNARRSSAPVATASKPKNKM